MTARSLSGNSTWLNSAGDPFQRVMSGHSRSLGVSVTCGGGPGHSCSCANTYALQMSTCQHKLSGVLSPSLLESLKITGIPTSSSKPSACKWNKIIPISMSEVRTAADVMRGVWGPGLDFQQWLCSCPSHRPPRSHLLVLVKPVKYAMLRALLWLVGCESRTQSGFWGIVVLRSQHCPKSQGLGTKGPRLGHHGPGSAILQSWAA